MSASRSREAGTTLVMGLVAVLVVLIVVGVGFVVYKHDHKTVRSDTTTRAQTQTTHTPPATTTTSGAAPNQSTNQGDNAFAIPEIHAKITLPSSLSSTDLKYSIDTSTGVPVADFTTVSLEQADGTGSCSASQAPIGAIWRTTQNPASGSVTTKQIGQYFYAFEKPQGSCTGNVNAGKLEQSQTSLLGQAFETIEQTN